MPDDNGIWVQSDVAPDGTYVVGLHYGEDRAWILTRDEAVSHAMAVITQTERAAHDAAVINLLHATLGMPLEDAAMFIANEIRSDRPPVEDPGPLKLTPGVSQRGGIHGFLTVAIDDTPVGQWEPQDAHHHAMAVLRAVPAVDNDAGLYRALVGLANVGEDRARAVVGDLARHRHAEA